MELKGRPGEVLQGSGGLGRARDDPSGHAGVPGPSSHSLGLPLDSMAVHQTFTTGPFWFPRLLVPDGPRSQVPGSRFRIPGPRFPGPRSQVTGPRSQVPGPRSRAPRFQVSGPRCQVPGPKLQVPGPRLPVPNARSQVPGPRSHVPSSRSRVPGRFPGPRSRVPGSQSQVIASTQKPETDWGKTIDMKVPLCCQTFAYCVPVSHPSPLLFKPNKGIKAGYVSSHGV